MLCPSPTGSSQLYSWMFFRAHSQPRFSHLPVCKLFPSRSCLSSCAMPEIPSLLPAPRGKQLYSHLPRETATCPRHSANRLVPKASTPKRAKLKPTHPATCSTTLLYLPFLQSCFSSTSLACFKVPSFSLYCPFCTSSEKLLSASSASSCKHLSSPNTSACTAGLCISFTLLGQFFFLLPMLYCDLYPPKCKLPANLSQSRPQPQNKCTGWSTTRHGKMDCKYFRKQQKLTCWGGGELVLHLLSCSKGCILTPYLWCRQQEGVTPRKIHPPLATQRYHHLPCSTSFLCQMLSLFLTGLQPACTSAESPVPQLLPDCSAALCRLLGCVMVISS